MWEVFSTKRPISFDIKWYSVKGKSIYMSDYLPAFLFCQITDNKSMLSKLF